jgi:hypothetical protein
LSQVSFAEQGGASIRVHNQNPYHKGSAMFEVTIVWEGEFFAHEATTETEAREWLAQYPTGAQCRARLWRLLPRVM